MSLESTIGSLLNQIYEVDSLPPEGIYDWAKSNGIKIIFISDNTIRIKFEYQYDDSDEVLAKTRANRLIKALGLIGYTVNNSSKYNKYDRNTELYYDNIDMIVDGILDKTVKRKGFRTLLGLK